MDLTTQYTERAAKKAREESVMSHPAISGLGFKIQSEGVYRLETERGAVMYYPGSSKWQHKGKILTGDPVAFRDWLTRSGLL
jgi:hypothetical protein